MADKVMTAEARIKATYTGDGFARAAADARRATKDLNALGGSRGMRAAARDMREMSFAAKSMRGAKFTPYADIVSAHHAAQASRMFRRSDYALARTAGMATGGGSGAGAGLGAMGLARGGALAAGVIGPAVTAYAGKQAVENWADLEMAVTRVGITAEASSGQVAAALKLFRDQGPAMGMVAKDMAGAADQFVAAGLDFETATSSVPATVRAAKASGGATEDLASAGIAAIQQFGFTANTLGRAYDIMAKGGKEGRYELRNMAKDLPSVGAGAKRLGLSGEVGLAKTVAALEIIRDSVGSADEAANRWENVSQKAFSEDTSKRFAKMGVNLEDEIKKGAKNGIDALQVLLVNTEKLTKGDPFKMAQLFGDMQVLEGMQAMVKNLPRLASLTKTILNDSAGTIENDYKRIADLTRQSMDRMGASFDRMAGNIGQSLSKVVVPAMDHISDVLEGKLGTPQESLDARRDFRLPDGTRMTQAQYDAMQAKLKERESKLDPTGQLTRAGVRPLGPAGQDAALRVQAATARQAAQAEIDDLRQRAATEDAALGTRGAINQHRRRNRDQQIAELQRKMDLPDAALAVASALAAQDKWGNQRRAFTPIGTGANGISSAPGGPLNPTFSRWGIGGLDGGKTPTGHRFVNIPDAGGKTHQDINSVLGNGKIEATVKPDQVKAELTGSAEVTGTGQFTITIDDGQVVRALAQQNQAMMQLRGEVRAGKSSSTSMPQYEK
ncbi:hypothetical protein GCM10019059_07730 [Camelimonas fluminis]|uniref:Phage tail tape measure protein n=1 Tax=Camelimonas fluminis TaxID=1576911 RepID=A0ABV7UEV5_9HYPH|nr:phage tail tape measure protein [Camelimonas fluminis]GHE50998.1 hypothetical protein GCM10019059_07730 [Camelimonas fluminis]